MGDITYTAKFEQRTPDRAAVTFNTVGGSFVETQVVTKGQKASKPEDSVKTGYEFVNWYADVAGATPYDFNTAVTADITIYAKWKKTAGREYTITWKDWNGTVLAISKVVESGLPKYLGASKPSRSGYIFTGRHRKLILQLQMQPIRQPIHRRPLSTAAVAEAVPLQQRNRPSPSPRTGTRMPSAFHSKIIEELIMSEEKLNELKEKVAGLQEELKELTPEEIEKVFGGGAFDMHPLFINTTWPSLGPD